MTRLAEAMGFVLCALICGWAFGSSPSPEPEPFVEEVVTQKRTVRPQADCPDETPALVKIQQLQGTLAEIERSLALLQAQEELVTGAPLEWPDDVSETYEESAIEAELMRVAEETGGVLVGLDCGEYPCVGLISWRGFDLDMSSAVRSNFTELWPEYRHGGFGVQMEPETGANTSHYISFGVPAQALAEDSEKRLRFRLGEITEIFDPREPWFGPED